MKTKILALALFAFLFANETNAQDVTTVNAMNREISDNLDLRAVASIFGDSRDLEDFERRLNDPNNKISNLDLNYDRQVDYLRVIESVERNTHLIILQAVLEKDVFQDVATIEVERDSNNNVQVQVVGDVYMYGSNYIYEPVYVTRPAIFGIFWVNAYRPYYSPYYWNYYPTYYYGWAPYPVYRYRNNVHVHIHNYNTYNYVNVRRSERAVAMHSTRRANGYERQYPNQSFTRRNNNVSNRYELDQTRNVGGTRTALTRNNATRNTTTAAPGRNRSNTATRSETTTPTRSNTPVRSSSNRNESINRSNTVRENKTVTPTRTPSVRTEAPTRSNAPSRSFSEKGNAPAVQPQRSTPSRNENMSRPQRIQKIESGNTRGNSGSSQRGESRR